MSGVLITAFEAFGGRAGNVSLETLKRLQAEDWGEVELHPRVLPVVRGEAPSMVESFVRELQPTVVIMLGEAAGRSSITPERIAVNLDDFEIRDNRGNQPRNETIVKDGPPHYSSTLPLDAMVHRLQQLGLPAEISDSAGRFVCNHVFYRVAHYIAQSGGSVSCGFIHLPRCLEQSEQRFSTEDLAEGVKVCIKACLGE
ncbi:pyroglutamyl-peptidase I [Pelagicoccus sp. SDUM812003]|uniref:pyroglutamyl-peptidase I n=1 Tax=Pelagicoccus sp. SDUM812003 TaxID=3041267 RepID=UPI00280EA1A9|nr:pyroglutamyl-peptidase I [Pelagicoccus sp. SDUM812003]MDQ8204888.1 pyroglutamyl-peptidase I [Pelagicoccus sp. SDUM812003]